MASYSLTNVSNLFKTKFEKLSENTYNSANVLLARAKKSYNFTGKNMQFSQPLSFSGGVGSGSLPTANYATYEDVVLTRKKLYARCEIEREAIKAAQSSEGAFVDMVKENVKKGVESYMRNMSRILFNELDNGHLGSFSGNAAGSASAPVLTITAATWKEANFEERDYINVNTLSSVWEITAVAPTTREVTLSRISGSDDLTAIGAGTHKVYMQNSKDNDPTSLVGVLAATSGTYYNLAIQRRWQAFQKSATSSGLTTDLMNECMLGVQRQCGKVPNIIVTSFTQYRKLLNILEDQKEYMVEPRSPELKGKVSFRGVEFMSSAGPVPVFPDRFCGEDKMLFLNDNFIEIKHAPDFGWFDDDGTVFMRTTGDNYEARYGGYKEIYVPPSYHGYLHSLAT